MKQMKRFFSLGCFDPASRLSPLFVGCIFLIILLALSLSRLHGFSMSMWHTHIDGSPHSEVLLGSARGIRSDDFVAVLPQVLSQTAHSPPFPVYNQLIGDGHCNMLINYAMPVLHWSTVFKPQVWGYFMGGDFGLAWNWWLLAGGVWIGLFLLIRRIAQGHAGIAAGAATVALYSPFFQYWSLNCAPSALFASLSIVAADQVFREQSGVKRIGFGLLLTWALTAFLFTFSFLPYLVSLLYVMFAIFVGLRTASALPGRYALLAFVLALLCTGLLMYAFIMENAETIQIAIQSSYPGKRFSAGGEASLHEIFRGWFLTWNHPPRWHAYGNICGAAAFCLFFPLSITLLASHWFYNKVRPNFLQITLIACMVWLLLWSVVGLPAPIARLTGLHRIPARRMMLAIGLCDLFLLCSTLRVHVSQPVSALFRNRILWGGLACFALLLALEGYYLKGQMPTYSLPKLTIAGSFSLILGALLMFRPKSFLIVFSVASIAATIWFNPLTQGGMDFIRNNPVSHAIRTAHQTAIDQGESPTWVAYGFERYDIYLPNLFRMLGIRSVDGVHPYPQPALFKSIDPDAHYEEQWNRYAHVRFQLPDNPDEFGIDLLQHDLIRVRLHPQDGRSRSLGITHVVVRGDATAFRKLRNLEELWSSANTTILRIIPEQE